MFLEIVIKAPVTAAPPEPPCLHMSSFYTLHFTDEPFKVSLKVGLMVSVLGSRTFAWTPVCINQELSGRHHTRQSTDGGRYCLGTKQYSWEKESPSHRVTAVSFRGSAQHTSGLAVRGAAAGPASVRWGRARTQERGTHQSLPPGALGFLSVSQSEVLTLLLICFTAPRSSEKPLLNTLNRKCQASALTGISLSGRWA